MAGILGILWLGVVFLVRACWLMVANAIFLNSHSPEKLENDYILKQLKGIGTGL